MESIWWLQIKAIAAAAAAVPHPHHDVHVAAPGPDEGDGDSDVPHDECKVCAARKELAAAEAPVGVA